MAVGLIGGNDAQQTLDSQDVVQAAQVVLPRQVRSPDMARLRGADESSPTPVPPQGHTPTAAAEQHGVLSAQENEGVETFAIRGAASADISSLATEFGDLSGAVSYTALGEIVAQYPWPINEAFRIVDCETGWTPDAVSWDGSSFGLFQIHAIHAYRWPDFWSEWDNPDVNTAWAYELYLEQGWAPWSCW